MKELPGTDNVFGPAKIIFQSLRLSVSQSA